MSRRPGGHLEPTGPGQCLLRTLQTRRCSSGTVHSVRFRDRYPDEVAILAATTAVQWLTVAFAGVAASSGVVGLAVSARTARRRSRETWAREHLLPDYRQRLDLARAISPAIWDFIVDAPKATLVDRSPVNSPINDFMAASSKLRVTMAPRTQSAAQGVVDHAMTGLVAADECRLAPDIDVWSVPREETLRLLRDRMEPMMAAATELSVAVGELEAAISMEIGA